MTGLIELGIHGQMGLGHHRQQFSPANQSRRVVQAVSHFIGKSHSHQHIFVRTVGSQFQERFFCRLQHRCLQKQVIACITSQAQFRKHDNFGLSGRRLFHTCTDLFFIIRHIGHFYLRRRRRHTDKIVSHLNSGSPFPLHNHPSHIRFRYRKPGFSQSEIPDGGIHQLYDHCIY